MSANNESNLIPVLDAPLHKTCGDCLWSSALDDHYNRQCLNPIKVNGTITHLPENCPLVEWS